MNAGDLFKAQMDAADIVRNTNIAYGMVASGKTQYAVCHIEYALESVTRLMETLTRLKASS